MEGEGKRTAIRHISALDGSRGVAVAGVLLFHGGHLTGGYLGVDFFFVLSGFLITSLLLAESTRTGSVGLGGFWSRRARRLLPALAVLMVGVALYCVAFGATDQLYAIRSDAFATLGYVANWRQIFSHHDYFSLFTSPSPLDHTWSLAIEEQFYVVWPLVFVGLLAWWKRATPKALLVVSLALAAVSTTLMFTLYDPADVSRAYFGTDTRATAILLGAALAAWLAIHGPARSHRARTALEAAGLAGAVVLAIAWSRLDGQSSTLYRGGFLLCGLAATAVIAAAVHPEPGPLSKALSFRPLCGLGLISYGVYLYHWPIDVAFDQKQMGFGGWPLFGFQTATTLAVAYASYRLVEQPIRRGSFSSAQMRAFTPAIAVGLVGLIVASTWGAPRITTFYKHPINAAGKAFDTAPKGSRRIMIVGDSVGFFLGPEILKVKAHPVTAEFNAALPGCSPVEGVSRKRFLSAFARTTIQPAATCDPPWLSGAVNRFRPHVVLSIVGNASNDSFYRGHWIATCSSLYASLYAQSMRKEIAVLGARGAHVVIVNAAYPRYLLAEQDRPTACENRVRRAVATETGTQFIDLFSYICPQGRCRTKQDGLTLRPDGEHYKGPGGELVAKWIIDQLPPLTSTK